MTTPLSSPPGAPTVTARIVCGELVPGSDFAGRYRILDELGRGGMGRVYKALDREINEAVALKVLGPALSADEKVIERFRNELKLARRISHKSVCRIFDLGSCEGIHYITMEFVPGDNLKRIIQMMGPPAPSRSLAVAGQVCDGLAEAHRLGVIHRDLKSSNIMIDREGNARIMDFGIASAAETKGLTDRGALVGTPEYMAPEQVEGGDVDRRADIYSLGVVLFEMATGRVPFEGKTPLSVVMQHRTARPPDPRDLNGQTPAGLSGIIARCLEKDPSARYQKIEDLAAELHGLAEGLKGTGPGRPRAETAGLTPGGTMVLNSIAVLPFADLSPKEDQAYFCEGLAEELITALARVRRLEVAARSSAFSPEFRAMDVRDVGRRLGVAAVLEGSVRKVENKLRITVQLINVGTGYQIWSERYERTLEDVFAIQDEITLAIVDRLRVKLLGEEKDAILKRHTADPEAYNLYLMGRFFWNKRTAEGMKRGLECFVRAIQIDPSFARAYTGIADCYGIFAYYYMPPRATLTKAREAAAKALELDPMLAEAHTSMAFVKQKLEWDWAAAEGEYKRALELDPEYVWAPHWYSLFLAAMGRHQESFVQIKRALEIEPTSAQMTMVHGMLFYLARFYDRAVEELRKAVELEPQHVLATFYLGLAHLESGRPDEALSLVSRAVELSGQTPFFIQGVGYVHATAGRRQPAEGVLATVREMMAKAYVSPVYQALIHFRLGEIDRGFEWLDKAYDEGDHWLDYIKVFPGFDNGRSDPRYALLIQKLGLK
ncbi:MAG TPA: tetratricopeptide repeat protein [Candidatus Aminicenantes bacterium]|nr:tetratricopeptide repeat protein [Candidatus Aminicenantes bacterium]